MALLVVPYFSFLLPPGAREVPVWCFTSDALMAERAAITSFHEADPHQTSATGTDFVLL